MINLFNSLNTLQKSLFVAIVALVLYIFTAGVSFSILSARLPGISNSKSVANVLPNPSQAIEEDPTQPKTEACPLDGSMHTKQAKDNWVLRRPLAVMIENHQESRPQSGLSSSNVVYEVVAEGGITRFMAVFLCNLSDIQVGPVRSARTYFLDWLSEYDALYAHVGGANTPGPADALGQVITYKVKDLNQFSIGFPTFWRDYQRLGHSVATEHTMYSSTAKLWDIGAKRGWTVTDAAGIRWDKNFVEWKFKDDQAGGSTGKIKVEFWKSQGNYTVDWNYDSTCNCYRRKHGGTDHTDLNNNKVLSPKVVIVQFAQESHANDGYENNAHLLYANKGTGRALVFQDGNVIEGTWSKPTRLSREKFLDKSGKEITFNRGQIWIQTVPIGSNVAY